MKTYDLGVTVAIALIALSILSGYLHKHNADCPVPYAIAEQAAEAEIDHLAGLPKGTAASLVKIVD